MDVLRNLAPPPNILLYFSICNPITKKAEPFLTLPLLSAINLTLALFCLCLTVLPALGHRLHKFLGQDRGILSLYNQLRTNHPRLAEGY